VTPNGSRTEDRRREEEEKKSKKAKLERGMEDKSKPPVM